MTTLFSKVPIGVTPVSGNDYLLVDQANAAAPFGYYTCRVKISDALNPVGGTFTGPTIINPTITTTGSASGDFTTLTVAGQTVATLATVAATYETQSHASATYQTIALAETSAHAAATYQTIANLSDVSSGANGAGLVGFLYSLTYGANTVGKWLKDLATSTGASFIGWIHSATGATLRTIQDRLRDHIHAFDFMSAAQIADIKAGTLTLDVTVPLQAFLDACKYGHGFLNPGKYKITAPLVLDYTASYWISGAGFDINAAQASVIANTANSAAITITNTTSNNYNPDLVLEHFCINGNNAGTSQKGVYAKRTPVNFKELYVTNCGGHAIHLENCFSSVLSNCIIAQNYLHGLWLDKLANEILVSHCAINGNSRTAGYAGINCVGTSGNENLNVVFLSCDVEGNGAAAASGYGAVVQYTHGVQFLGHYSEGNKTNTIYADNTVKNIKIDSSYFQDESVSLVACDGITYTNNRHFFNSIATDVAISGNAASPIKIEGNTYGASVTTNFTVGAKQRIEQYDTASPASGTWSVGDIIWHRTPTSGGNLGWVCTTAGTPGTWKTFGTIA